jgi:beta-aspartyl-peptidase (threonine type)
VAALPSLENQKNREKDRGENQIMERSSSPPWELLARKLSEQEGKMGTVGAVARDLAGNVAAGTSTGGINRMLPGRVGDSPLIGAGTYADNGGGAVSMTGDGEAIIRVGMAKETSIGMEWGLSAEEAGRRVLIRMRRRTGGEAGMIALSAKGDFEILHTTRYMPAGYRSGGRGRVAGRFRRIREE